MTQAPGGNVVRSGATACEDATRQKAQATDGVIPLILWEKPNASVI